MKKILAEDLKRIILDHKDWLHTNGKMGSRANLSETDLSGIEMPEANLMMADLSGANLSGTNLLLVDLSQAKLKNADLSGADLSGADLLLANFHNANLSGADLAVSDLSGANLSGARLHASLLQEADLSGSNLTDAQLLGADLSGADLSGANLGGADLSGANLSGASLVEADLRGANLLLVSTKGTDFTNALLSGVIIDSLTLAKLPAHIAQKYQNSFQIIDPDHFLEFSIMREMEFPKVYFHGALLFISFFASFLARKYMEKGVRVRVEFRGITIKIVAESPSEIIRNEVNEFFEIYGLVIEGKLDPDALSNDKNDIERFNAQIELAQILLEKEFAIKKTDEATVEKESIVWLRKYLGRFLCHIEHENNIKDSSISSDHFLQPYTNVQKFQSFLKTLIGGNEQIRSELSVLFKKLSLEFPDDKDLEDMGRCLSAIKVKSPVIFSEISSAFYELGLEKTGTIWGELLGELMEMAK